MKKRVILGLVAASALTAGAASAGTFAPTGTAWKIAAEKARAGKVTSIPVGVKLSGVYTPSDYDKVTNFVPGAIIPYTDTTVNISVDSGSLLTVDPATIPVLQLCKLTAAGALVPGDTTNLVAKYANGSGTNALLLAAVGTNGQLMANGQKYSLAKNAGAGGDCNPLVAGDITLSVAAAKSSGDISVTFESYRQVPTDAKYDKAKTALAAIAQEVVATVGTKYGATISAVATDAAGVPTIGGVNNAFTAFASPYVALSAADAASVLTDDLVLTLKAATTAQTAPLPPLAYDTSVLAAAVGAPGVVAAGDVIKIVLTPTSANGLAVPTVATPAPTAAMATPAAGLTSLMAVSAAGSIASGPCVSGNAGVVTCTLTSASGAYVDNAGVNYTLLTTVAGSPQTISAKNFTATVEVTFADTTNLAADTGANAAASNLDAGAWLISGYQAIVPYISKSADYMTQCMINNKGSNPADISVDVLTQYMATPAGLTGLSLGQVLAGQQAIVQFNDAGVGTTTTAALAPLANVNPLTAIPAWGRYSAKFTVTGVTADNVYTTCFQNTPNTAGNIKRNVDVLVLEPGKVNTTFSNTYWK
jgi:hypothetical protein